MLYIYLYSNNKFSRLHLLYYLFIMNNQGGGLGNIFRQVYAIYENAKQRNNGEKVIPGDCLEVTSWYWKGEVY